MKQVVFEYAKWHYNSATIYAALNDPKLRPTVPTLIELTDGFCVICVPNSDATLAPSTMSVGPQFPIMVTEPIPVSVAESQKPIVTGVSENTLLKAIAITKDATLALNLIKE